MMMTVMISIIPIILIHTLFYVGFSDDMPLTTTLPQSPTSPLPHFHLYNQNSNSYPSSTPLEESKRRSPPPRRRSPPPPPRRSPPPPPRRSSPPPPPPRIRSPPPPRPPPPPPPPLLFDHFKLSQTWPPTYCKLKNNDCVSPLPQKFTIHGLWPSKEGVEIRDCNKDGINVNDFVPIKTRLNENWPALFKKDHQEDANIQLWVNQWYAHGTCSDQLFKFISYFEETLNVYDRHIILDILEKNGTKPGGTYPKQNILNAIQTHTLFRPQIRCERIDNLDYLYEIRLCLTPTLKLEYKDCEIPYSGCRDTEVYF
ncbi:ribonuclease MC [Lathyrus oleraceus]|nr:ribonuclease MC-like [Pisum sativum]